MASLANVTASGNKTIQMTISSSANCGIFAMEVSGGDTSSFFDIGNGSTGNSSNGSTTLVTTVDGALIIAGCSAGASEPTAGSGYTIFNLANQFWFDTSERDLDVGTAGSKSANFVHSSGQWIVKAAAFKPATGGGATRYVHRQILSGVG
jgi:hypothetical protein